MRRAQFWYGDFLVAVLILMIIGVLFVASIRDLTSRNEILKDLTIEASDISSVLMSEGTDPLEWQNDIGTIGLMTDNKFDYDKFNQFLNLGNEKQNSMLGTYNKVWVYLEDRNGDINVGDENLGYDSINDVDSSNLVHIKRFVFYNGDIYTLGVVVFQ